MTQQAEKKRESVTSASGPDASFGPSSDVGSYVFAGSLVAFLLVGVVGVWAATTELAGAVLAPGAVVVDGNVKKLQHLSGGIIGSIHVKNGDSVAAGDVLVRLDDTITRANLQVVTKQLDEMAGRAARLKAERDGLDEVPLPAAFSGRRSEPQIAEILAGEQSLFESRLKTREGQKAQLSERIDQLVDEGEGVINQTDAKQREIDLIARELDQLADLEEKKLVTSQKMMSMRREVARLDGEVAHLKAQAAQLRGKISEIRLQILQIDQELRTEIVKELRDIQAKEGELIERKTAAEDQLRRVDIRAPQDGIVHQMSVTTIGGTLNPGEPILQIVPQNERLVIDARIAPQDIDQARASRAALIRFPAFNQRTTPEVSGRVVRLSPEVITEQPSGQMHYLARIEIDDDQMARLGGLKLLPGMPVEVQIRTGDRTAFTYLMKPLTDQFAKAFRER